MFGWYQNCFYLCTRFSEVKYSGCSAVRHAGRAGVSAGIYAASRGLETLILEQKAVGGIIGRVSTVTHYAPSMPFNLAARISMS